MSSITVIARARAKKGFESQLEKALQAVVIPTHAEEGCLKYSIQRSVEDPASFIILEKWSSKEAIDKHMASSHIQELLKKLPELITAAPEIQAFHPISGGLPGKSGL